MTYKLDLPLTDHIHVLERVVDGETASSKAEFQFFDHMRDVCGYVGAGHYFEEGGCWGMALALQSVIGGELVIREDFVHTYVRLDGQLYDWSGDASFNGPVRIVSEQELMAAALSHGMEDSSVRSDREWAANVIQGAKEMAQLELVPEAGAESRSVAMEPPRAAG